MHHLYLLVTFDHSHPHSHQMAARVWSQLFLHRLRLGGSNSLHPARPPAAVKGRDNEPSSRVLARHVPGRISNSTGRCNSTSSSNTVYIVTFTCESAHPAFPLPSKNTCPKAIALARAERRSSDGGRTGRRLHPTKHQNLGQARRPEVGGLDDGPDHA